jgi:ornithine--oxo-acid transaminase
LALPPDACLEGGDVCVFDGSVLAGWGFRSHRAAHAALSERLGVPVHSLRLVAPSLYHLDMCLCPLDDRHALVAPDALDADSVRVVEELVPEPLELRLEEALSFCANAIVLDRTVVMSQCPHRLRALLERHGFEVCVTPVEEFTKSGGAVSCLTLPLDRSVRCVL